MDYARILTGREKPLPVYKEIIVALENPLAFPDLLEPIYREAMKRPQTKFFSFPQPFYRGKLRGMIRLSAHPINIRNNPRHDTTNSFTL